MLVLFHLDSCALHHQFSFQYRINSNYGHLVRSNSRGFSLLLTKVFSRRSTLKYFWAIELGFVCLAL